MDDPFRAERRAMVAQQLRARGIRDPGVLAVMEEVPRHLFLPPQRWALAYLDQAVLLQQGQTLSQPYMVAAMTEALALRPEDRVLEVGTGSGYQAAVLARLAREVYTVERLPALARSAAELLDDLGASNVRVRVGDGSLGWPEHAPFDAILVTAAAPAVPPALKAQLSPDGGRLVAPVGDREVQELVRHLREGNELVGETLMGCRFVPLLGEGGWAPPDGE
jgi:protein-L-isoaspartate(D-aspartate) O-methyltransferase